VSLAGPAADGWIHDEWLAIIAAAVDGLGVDEGRFVRYRQHGGNQIGARRLDLRGAMGRFTEDGVDRNRRLLARAQSLVGVLDRMPGVTEDRKNRARAKALHERRRTELEAARFLRIGPAISEWRTGRYRMYGNGVPDLVRDLVQPRRGD
jgi:hypothetical protein